MSETGGRSSVPLRNEKDVLALLSDILQKNDVTPALDVPVRKGLHRRVVDLVGKWRNQTLVFEVRAQPASIDAVSALRMVSRGRKFIVSPRWESDSVRQFAESQGIRLISPSDLQTSGFAAIVDPDAT